MNIVNRYIYTLLLAPLFTSFSIDATQLIVRDSGSNSELIDDQSGRFLDGKDNLHCKKKRHCTCSKVTVYGTYTALFPTTTPNVVFLPGSFINFGLAGATRGITTDLVNQEFKVSADGDYSVEFALSSLSDSTAQLYINNVAVPASLITVPASSAPESILTRVVVYVRLLVGDVLTVRNVDPSNAIVWDPRTTGGSGDPLVSGYIAIRRLCDLSQAPVR